MQSPQTAMRLKIVINVRRLAYAEVYRLAQKFHKTKAHDGMTKLFQCYKLPVNKVSFAQLFYGIVNKIIALHVRCGM